MLFRSPLSYRQNSTTDRRRWQEGSPGQRVNRAEAGSAQEGGEGMGQTRNPVSQEIVKERNRIVIRFGDSTLTLTAGGITLELKR